MNQTRKAKLKSIILKLPFGAQLLQLRHKIMAQKRKKHQLKAKRLNEKQKMRLKRLTEKNNRKRKMILLKSIDRERKLIAFSRVKLHDKKFYDSYSVKSLEIFQRYSQVPPELATAFEIGAGLYLAAPIGLSLLGFKKVITTDIRRAEPRYVQWVIKYYQKHATEFGITRRPKIKAKITDANLDDFLLRNFNIDYRAPYNVAQTDLPDDSVDYVYSQVSFEHIRAELLPDIMKEMYRILRGGGVLLTVIDYKDHRSYYNANLTIYDYLRYTSAEWGQHDCESHNNRLRTADYKSIFISAGFEIIKIKSVKITDSDRAAFATVKVADEFKKKYTDEELMEKGAQFILRKPSK